MTKTFRHYAAAILASLGFALPASATTFSIDYTDLWYNAPVQAGIESEPGWGVNVIQQSEIIFATLFVYGTDGTPRWYVGPSTASNGANSFTGLLYSTTGTYFGTGWTGSGFIQAGTITFGFTSATTGTLSYTVGNVTVTKNIVRQSWRNDVLTGNYIGGTTARGPSSCGDDILISGELRVTHSSPSISMIVTFVSGAGQLGTCTYSGTYSQVGSIGAITGGSFNCTIGGVSNALFGTYSIAEITNSRNGFNGRLTHQDQFCTYTGFFGGIKDVI